MIEIRAEGPAVTLRCEGKPLSQMKEFAAAFHVWAHHVADETEVRDALRDQLVDWLTNDDLWHIQPERTEQIVEVDIPEELFDQGGD